MLHLILTAPVCVSHPFLPQPPIHSLPSTHTLGATMGSLGSALRRSM